jgi:hypothetical protein
MLLPPPPLLFPAAVATVCGDKLGLDIYVLFVLFLLQFMTGKGLDA